MRENGGADGLDRGNGNDSCVGNPQATKVGCEL
jgi:hypothetical protein